MPRKSNRSTAVQPSSSKAAAKRIQSSDDESGDSEHEVSNRSVVEPTSNIPNLITNFVKYVINYSGTKMPIKRTDMSKALNIPSKEFSQVCDEAEAILRDVYGLELAEVPESKSGKMYIVCSLLTNVSYQAVSEDQRREGLLLFIILSYIFMKGGEVQENHVTQFIKDLPLSLNFEEREDYVNKLIKETFSRQLYLKRTKVEIEGRNEPEIHLAWGARADMEFDKKTILEAVSKIMHKSPLNFATQYSEAHGNAEETVMID